METLLNYEAEVRETRLKCEGYEEDVSLDVKYPLGANSGLKAQEVRFNKSKEVRLSGRVPADLWNKEKLIPPCIKLDFHLLPARPSFFIKSVAADEPGN